MLRTAFRISHLIIQTITLGAVIWFNWRFPLPRDKLVKEAASQRGWSTPIIFLTRSIQHFTIISALILVLAILATLILEPSHEFVTGAGFIAHNLQTSVGVLYHSLITINPFYLFPKLNFPKDPNRVVRALTSWFPPFEAQGFTLILWAVLHIQHTLAPLHMWIDVYLNSNLERGWAKHQLESYSLEIELLIITLCVFLYGAWNLLCWYVRTEPAYPIQSMVWQKGGFHIASLYFGFIFCTLICSYLCRRFREYIVYEDGLEIPFDSES